MNCLSDERSSRFNRLMTQVAFEEYTIPFLFAVSVWMSFRLSFLQPENTGKLLFPSERNISSNSHFLIKTYHYQWMVFSTALCYCWKSPSSMSTQLSVINANIWSRPIISTSGFLYWTGHLIIPSIILSRCYALQQQFHLQHPRVWHRSRLSVSSVWMWSRCNGLSHLLTIESARFDQDFRSSRGMGSRARPSVRHWVSRL